MQHFRIWTQPFSRDLYRISTWNCFRRMNCQRILIMWHRDSVNRPLTELTERRGRNFQIKSLRTWTLHCQTMILWRIHTFSSNYHTLFLLAVTITSITRAKECKHSKQWTQNKSSSFTSSITMIRMTFWWESKPRTLMMRFCCWKTRIKSSMIWGLRRSSKLWDFMTLFPTKS